MIRIRNQQKTVRVGLNGVKQAAARALRSSGDCPRFLRKSASGGGAVPGTEIHILIVDDREIARLHWRHLKVRGPTDVMAFGMQEGKRIAGSECLLGDVVLSAETAKRVAKELGIPVQQEIERYVIHGILHLLGYRDDTPVKARKMHQRQEELVAKVPASFLEKKNQSPKTEVII